MKYVALLLLLAAAGTGPGMKPEIRYFHYERKIENTPQAARQTCVAVDPAIFAHAAPSLRDLRLYRGTVETPYVLREAKPKVKADEQAAVLNLGRSRGQTVFDAAMPAGEYRDVRLDVTGQNFIATVQVSGSQKLGGARQTKVGFYTIFDLTRQKLGRSTVLHLPQSDFRFLYFRIEGPIAPENVKGLTVLRTSASKPKYVTVATTSSVTQMGRDTVIRFTVPAYTPVDRVVFVPGASPRDFSRDVRVRVQPEKPPKLSDSAKLPATTSSNGNLLRIHRVEEGHQLNEERLSVNAPPVVSYAAARLTMAAHWPVATRWTVRVENGDDPPIQIRSVRLEMVERDLCFHAEGATGYTLYYGDPALPAPHYDYAKLFVAQADAATASTGAELVNPVYQRRPDTRPYTEKHPWLMWVALIVVIVVLGAIAVRSAKHNTPNAQ